MMGLCYFILDKVYLLNSVYIFLIMAQEILLAYGLRFVLTIPSRWTATMGSGGKNNARENTRSK